ncbi:hypothetical protein NM962_12640 [Mycobacterium sp. SVM_VP21]|nr:hypothetical protein NM962_12640 [Mycobacterium sp. SVM_VP21]
MITQYPANSTHDDAPLSLPAGAVAASEVIDGTRVVFGEPQQVGAVSVCATAIQTLAGTIIDSAQLGRPSVQLGGGNTELTPQQARQLARALQEAAEQADRWATTN